MKWLESFDVDKPLRILKYFSFYSVCVCVVWDDAILSLILGNMVDFLYMLLTLFFFQNGHTSKLSLFFCHPSPLPPDFILHRFLFYFLHLLYYQNVFDPIFHWYFSSTDPPFVTTAFCLIMLTIWSFLVELCDISPCVCQYILLHDIFTMNTRRIALHPLQNVYNCSEVWCEKSEFN